MMSSMETATALVYTHSTLGANGLWLSGLPERRASAIHAGTVDVLMQAQCRTVSCLPVLLDSGISLHELRGSAVQRNATAAECCAAASSS